jgi:hypothetical protein
MLCNRVGGVHAVVILPARIASEEALDQGSSDQMLMAHCCVVFPLGGNALELDQEKGTNDIWWVLDARLDRHLSWQVVS